MRWRLLLVVLVALAALSCDAEFCAEEKDDMARFNRANDLNGTLTGINKDARLGRQQATRVRVGSGGTLIGTIDLQDRQIVAQDFRTAPDVGETGGPAGIRFNSDEIAGYSAGDTREFRLRSSDGAAEFAGGDAVMDEDGIAFSGTSQLIRWLAAAAAISASNSNELFITVTDLVHVGSRIIPSSSQIQDLGELGGIWHTSYVDRRVIQLSASEDLDEGDAVWITGSGTVGKTLSGISQHKVAGVVAENASSGNAVAVAVSGSKINVTANEAISPGDIVAISTSVAGRVVKVSPFATGAGTSHDHAGSSDHLTSETNHSHGPGTLSTDADSHSHSGIDSHGTADTNHSHGAGTYEADLGDGDVSGNSGPESFTLTHGSTDSDNHSHDVDSGSTGPESFALSHDTTGSESSHTHSVSTGVVLGKALTSAAGAGSTFTILVTLGG